MSMFPPPPPQELAAVHPLLALRRLAPPPAHNDENENVLPRRDGEHMTQDHQHQQQKTAAEIAMAKKRKRHHQFILQQQQQQQQQRASSASSAAAATSSSPNSNKLQKLSEEAFDATAVAAAAATASTVAQPQRHQLQQTKNIDCHPLLRQEDAVDDCNNNKEAGPKIIFLTADDSNNSHVHGDHHRVAEYNDEANDNNNNNNNNKQALTMIDNNGAKVPYKIPKKSKYTSTTTSNSTETTSYGNNNTRALPAGKKKFVEEICWKELLESGVNGLRNKTAGNVWDENSDFFATDGYKFPAFAALYNRTRTAVILQHTNQKSAPPGSPEKKKKKTSPSTAATGTSKNFDEKKIIVEMECKKVLESSGPDALRKFNPADIWDAHYDVLSKGGYHFDAFRKLARRVRMRLLGEKEERRSSASATHQKPSTSGRGKRATISTKNTSKPITASISSRPIPLQKKKLIFRVCTNELNASGVQGLRQLLPAKVWSDNYELLSKGNYEFSAFKAYYTRARAAIVDDHLKATGATTEAASLPCSSARQLRHHNREEDPIQQQVIIDSLKQQVEYLTQTVQLHSEEMNQLQLERAIAGVALQKKQRHQQKDGMQQTSSTESTTSAGAGKTNSSISDNKYCIFCGTMLPVHAAFCCSCGKQCPIPSSAATLSSSSSTASTASSSGSASLGEVNGAE